MSCRRRQMPSIWTVVVVVLTTALLLSGQAPRVRSQESPQRLVVPMTLVRNASSIGAVCLDGSSPAYHFSRGSGSGADNWLLQFEGGGWCNSFQSCLDRSTTRRGSTNYMTKMQVFSGILSNDPTMNPDFYNWNRVKIRYCDGASFGGDSEFSVGNTTLHFRGYRIFIAVIQDLLPKGLLSAKKALLSGCSAGGLATFLHCDGLRQLLPRTCFFKCLSDAGFFLNANDISGKNHVGTFFNEVVSLQKVQKNLNHPCVGARKMSYECIFPQYSLPYIKTPYFILNTAYDTYQLNHIFLPPSSDPSGKWKRCKANPLDCSPSQLLILQGFMDQMVGALKPVENSKGVGFFINSCFAHCQSELQQTWFEPKSPTLHSKTIAESVGDWFFERNVVKEIDCPYPCDLSCQKTSTGS